MLARVNAALAAAVKAAVVAMVAVMTVALAAQVGLRYVFNVTLSWSEELSLGLFTWTMLLMAALGVREGFHVRMALGIERLGGAARRAAERAIHLATAALGAFLAGAGWRYVAETQGSTSAAIGYPVGLLYASGVACGVLIVFFALEAAIEGRIPSGDAPADEHGR